jgi:hypothetical protein
MSKKKIEPIETIENFEISVFQITVADLANNNNYQVVNNIIEFKDVKLSFDIFKNCFFDNNYNHFEINNQFRNIEALGINSQVIKENCLFKNYSNSNKVNIINILISNYIQNKKNRMDDITKISLINDFCKYDSLVDFKIYNNNLNLDDVFTLLNNYKHKNIKKYFRFKIKATYYSSILDETIAMYFNYIVKIPKNNSKQQTIDDKYVYEEYIDDETQPEESIIKEYQPEESIIKEYQPEESIIKEYQPEESIIKEYQPEESIIKEYQPEESIIKEYQPGESILKNIINNNLFFDDIYDSNLINNLFFDPLLEINKHDTIENIVYSNYNKKNENITINNDEDDDNDEDYDDTSESNLSDSSFDVNSSDNLFFLKDYL